MVLKLPLHENEETTPLLQHEGGDNIPDTDPQDKHWFPYLTFMRSVFHRFDTSFVWILIIENFNFGLFILIILCAQDLFKAYLHQEPGDMALYKSLIMLPWVFKVIYGFISDNVKLCGLKRKPYLIFFAFTQFVSMFAIFQIETEEPLIIVMLLVIASLSMAFSNVVVDAILVI